MFNSVIRILVKKHEKKKEISSNQIAYYSTNLFALRIVEFYHNFFCTSLYMLRIKYTEHWLSYIFLETRREKKYILPQTILKQIKKLKSKPILETVQDFNFRLDIQTKMPLWPLLKNASQFIFSSLIKIIKWAT